ncbi:hypothetical protein HY932_00085 [Candidatus Falkowbacteria bacterium]|nr:hypothetical protein [Candidatus Falkowbacteria bacterium]
METPGKKQKRDAKTRSLIDFVRDNEDGLYGLTRPAAQFIVESLADAGMDASQLFARVVCSSEPNFLFVVLYDWLSKDAAQRLRLLDAVVTAPETVWSYPLSASFVATKFTRAEDFEHLLKRHRTALLYRYNELQIFGCFSSDEYWRKRVQQYIAKYDWRRAWDEFHKARRGFFTGTKKVAPKFGKVDLTWYHYEASKSILVALIHELFNIMASYRLLAKFTAAEIDLLSNSRDALANAMERRIAEYFQR